MGQNPPGMFCGEFAGIDKEIIGRGGHGSLRCEFGDNHSGQRGPAQTALAAGAKHAITIADCHQTGGGSLALDLRGAEQDKKFTGPVARGVAGRPCGSSHHGNAACVGSCRNSAGDDAQERKRPPNRRDKEGRRHASLEQPACLEGWEGKR